MRKRTAIVYHALAKMLLAITALLVFAACQTTGKSAPQVKAERGAQRLYVVGHRGATGLAPENTLSSFIRACDVGVHAIELDVHLTADGKIVVHHDYLLKPEITRTPKGEWLDEWSSYPIKDLTLAQLKRYDIGRLKPYTSYSNRYPVQRPMDGERIPTLREVASLLKNRNDKKTELWIEIKTSPEKPKVTQSPEVVADALIQVLQEEKVLERVKILSFDWRALVHIQKIAPDIPTVYLSHTGVRLDNIKPGQPGPAPWTAGIDVDEFEGSIPRAVKAAGGRYWAPNYKTITPTLVQEAHRLGMKVFVWTPDSQSDMVRLMDMGVDGIITNRPDILLAVISGL